MAYMRQVYGMGEYDELATPWSWMYYPPPYDFADPLAIAPPPTFIASARSMGFGGCGCGGKCGGCGGGHAHGMGLFDSGWDLSGWGLAEWGIVAVGAYVAYSVLFTTGKGIGTVRSSSRKRASRARRRAELQAELAGT